MGDKATEAASKETQSYIDRGGQIGVTPVGSPVSPPSSGGGGSSGSSGSNNSTSKPIESPSKQPITFYDVAKSRGNLIKKYIEKINDFGSGGSGSSGSLPSSTSAPSSPGDIPSQPIVEKKSEVRIPSVGGYTTFIAPSGDYFDAPTSQYGEIIKAGGKVAPTTKKTDYYSESEVYAYSKYKKEHPKSEESEGYIVGSGSGATFFPKGEEVAAESYARSLEPKQEKPLLGLENKFSFGQGKFAGGESAYIPSIFAGSESKLEYLGESYKKEVAKGELADIEKMYSIASTHEEISKNIPPDTYFYVKEGLSGQKKYQYTTEADFGKNIFGSPQGKPIQGGVYARDILGGVKFFGQYTEIEKPRTIDPLSEKVFGTVGTISEISSMILVPISSPVGFMKMKGLISGGKSIISAGKEIPIFERGGKPISVEESSRLTKIWELKTKGIGGEQTSAENILKTKMESGDINIRKGTGIIPKQTTAERMQYTINNLIKDTKGTFAPGKYEEALAKGAAPISERGVMGIQFGSKGYSPEVKSPSGLMTDYFGTTKIPEGFQIVPQKQRLVELVNKPSKKFKFEESLKTKTDIVAVKKGRITKLSTKDITKISTGKIVNPVRGTKISTGKIVNPVRGTKDITKPVSGKLTEYRPGKLTEYRPRPEPRPEPRMNEYRMPEVKVPPIPIPDLSRGGEAGGGGIFGSGKGKSGSEKVIKNPLSDVTFEDVFGKSTRKSGRKSRGKNFWEV